MKNKITHYKSIYKDSSLLFKVKILNVFVLPISCYKLKVFHPPETYFQEVHKMICDFLWERKRHWVKPLFVYLPFENGGVVIKNNFVQYFIFKQRAILKGLILIDSFYFLRKLRHLAYDFLFSNKVTDPNFSQLLVVVNKVNQLKKFFSGCNPEFQFIFF